MFTILLSMVLQNYHLVFAICLSIQNSAQILWDLKNIFRPRPRSDPQGGAGSYNERSYILLELVYFLESVVFLLVGISGVLRGGVQGSWQTVLVVILVTWMMLSLVQSFYELCMKKSLDYCIPHDELFGQAPETNRMIATENPITNRSSGLASEITVQNKIPITLKEQRLSNQVENENQDT